MRCGAMVHTRSQTAPYGTHESTQPCVQIPRSNRTGLIRVTETSSGKKQTLSQRVTGSMSRMSHAMRTRIQHCPSQTVHRIRCSQPKSNLKSQTPNTGTNRNVDCTAHVGTGHTHTHARMSAGIFPASEKSCVATSRPLSRTSCTAESCALRRNPATDGRTSSTGERTTSTRSPQGTG